MVIQSRVGTVIRTIAVVVAMLAPAAGLAQNNPSSTSAAVKNLAWQPWLGCWTPVERAPRDRDIQVCITLGSDRQSARLTTFAGDQRLLNDSILPDGSNQTTDEDGCRGSSRSQWAKSADRLFRVTELQCDGKAPQRTAEIATFENPDEWLDVQVVFTGGRDNVRTRRYVRSTQTPPGEIGDQVRGSADRAAGVNTAIGVDDVIEANAIVSPRAVEAWLSESGARLPVRKATLVALHGANVPSNVIDLMIARAYPAHFEVRRSGGGGSVGSFFDDVFWLSPSDLMFDPYAFYYSPFGSYNRYVDPSFYSLGGYVVVPAPSGGAVQESGTARVVNGAGYTRVEPRQPAVIVGPRPSGSSADSSNAGSSSSGGSSSSSSSGASGASASSSGYSGGGGGGQTAVPR